jgi:hypothetical protein
MIVIRKLKPILSSPRLKRPKTSALPFEDYVDAFYPNSSANKSPNHVAFPGDFDYDIESVLGRKKIAPKLKLAPEPLEQEGDLGS